MSLLRRRLMMAKALDTPIAFEDEEVKRICVKYFGGAKGITNSAYGTVGVKGIEGELTYRQALAVTSLLTLFRDNSSITKFNEFRLFENVRELTLLAFSKCSNLEEITLPKLIILNGYIFYICSNLRVLKGDTLICNSNCNHMFMDCVNLESIIINSLDTSKLSNAHSMFKNCAKLVDVGVQELDMSSVKITTNLFYGCSKLKKLPKLRGLGERLALSNCGIDGHNSFVFSGLEAIENADSVFAEDFNAKGFDRSVFNRWNIYHADMSKWTNLKQLSFSWFSGCYNFEGATLPAHDFNVRNSPFYLYGKNYRLPMSARYVRFLSDTPPSSWTGYKDIPINIYVPSNSIDVYKEFFTNNGWNLSSLQVKSLEEWDADADKFGWTKK